MARAGSQGRLINWEEDEEESPAGGKEGSDSSESFICVSEEAGWEGPPQEELQTPQEELQTPQEEPRTPQEEPRTPQEESQTTSKQTPAATPASGDGRGGGGEGKSDSDSDWERWSD